MSESTDVFKRSYRHAIRRNEERTDPLPPVRHLVADGKPLTAEGAALQKHKNAAPPEAPKTSKINPYSDWRSRR